MKCTNIHCKDELVLGCLNFAGSSSVGQGCYPLADVGQ